MESRTIRNAIIGKVDKNEEYRNYILFSDSSRAELARPVMIGYAKEGDFDIVSNGISNEDADNIIDMYEACRFKEAEEYYNKITKNAGINVVDVGELCERLPYCLKAKAPDIVMILKWLAA